MSASSVEGHHGLKKLSKTKINDTDDVLYQICLRTVYEVCKADLDDLVSMLVLNGWGLN